MCQIWGETGLLNWWKLRSVGNLAVLKISYGALAAAPFLTKFKVIGQALNLYDDNIVLASFLGGILLGAANLFYDIGCPVIIKRFDSPNVLYKEMLQIKVLSLLGDRPDAFDATLGHCRTAYVREATANKGLGLVSGILFSLAAAFFLFVLLDRIYTVIASFVHK